MAAESFPDLPELAQRLRTELETEKFVLLYAYNGTGKTRLSGAFKDLGKDGDARDTLYFNAFTEDLFNWDNDLDDDTERVLVLNTGSRYFEALKQVEMDTRIRRLLARYVTFEFKLDSRNVRDENDKVVNTEQIVRFFREEQSEGVSIQRDNIKVSRGEENIFIWCFFLAILELAMDPDIETYKWVKYVYVDDPISSLDEHNAIMVANHLAQLLSNSKDSLKTVVSTHHTLFFNVLGNEFRKKAHRYFLSRGADDIYLLRETGNTPFFHHVASLRELSEAADSGELRTHHFNMMRAIMEKTASFHGYGSFADCIRLDEDDPDKTMYARVINIMSHGNYSLYEPVEMMDENKAIFRKMLSDFRKHFPFNSDLFDTPINEPPAT